MNHADRQGPDPVDTYGGKWASHVDSSTRQRIRREVYGDEFPAEVDPRSFLTWTELRQFALELRVGSGDMFVDLGCGHGGPALWVANETGADVLGIDLSAVAIDRASERADELGLADRARFEVGDIVATGLPDAGFDGAMSVDTLWSVPDKLGAIREIARILKPGARFAFTNWDRDRQPPGYPPPLDGHRSLLEQTGFVVEHYDLQLDAEVKRRAYYERVVAAEPILLQEMGEEAMSKLMFEAKGTLGLVDGVDYLAHSSRIFVVARKKSSSAAC
jgi:ubiquinone/menaquinone biosynthesis C-methylase UbiE